MKQELIADLQYQFNLIAHNTDDKNIEFWYARDLQIILGYDKWENFFKVIEKAKISCENSQIEISDHFLDVRKMVEVGSNAQREIKDIVLTRYTCYLIAQNGDSSKEQVAFAQIYFALQTRKQELIEQRIELEDRLKARNKLKNSETELSKNIYERGVDDKGFGRIRSKGDGALFGGFNTQEMKDKLCVPSSRVLADFLPTVTITYEHVINNSNVRKLLVESGIKPEELPPSQDLQKLERKVKSDEKKLIKSSALPKKK